MILVDTNVLVALVDERDRLHPRAKRDLRKLRGPFGVTSAILCECCFLLEASYLRQRLNLLLEQLACVAIEPESPWWGDVFTWLERYADQSPDLCDGLLTVLSARMAATIWSYDREFHAIWRDPVGKRLKVVPASRAK
jgi:predicted nucleic acid-binding protein